MNAPERATGEAAALLQVGGAAISPPSSTAVDPELLQALAAWRTRLVTAGLACRAVAVHAANPAYVLPMPVGLGPGVADLAERWETLRAQVHLGAPAQVSRPAAAGGDLLVASALQMPDGELGVIGIALPPPHLDRSVQWLLLSLGWLQLALSAPRVDRSLRAGQLLELMAQVASQSRARSAAQEWINRSAAWARELADPVPQREAAAPPLSLLLFEVRHQRPHWWVSADAAWVEKAAPGVQAAVEVATQAVHDQDEVRQDDAWAMPALAEGQVRSVLVVLHERGGLGEAQRQLLRASLAAGEPLLHEWQVAERPLWRHALQSTAQALHRLHQPGHWAWKAGAAGVTAALAIVLLWPVTDRVTANGAIEGRQRLVVTAPFDGFIGQVLVRPGARVQAGQVLARLDDRDLRLEQSRYRSEREQAAGRLRQAMTDHDAPALALATAEVQQADAQLQLVDAKLARTSLSAPRDGLLVTGDWAQQVGSPVETGKEMFEIASGEGYRVVLHVADRDIARVHGGQHGAMRLTGQPHASYEFQVATVTATASVEDGLNGFRVEADWVGTAPPLSPGMQGVGKIDVGSSNLFTVWTRSSIDWLRLKLWALGW